MLASGNASALIDWNNNYGDDHNKCVAQHCSNYPRSFVGANVEVSNLDVMSNAIGEGPCFGAIKGNVAAGPMTYLRFSTDDTHGRIRGYVGEGEFTNDPFNMSGGIAVCQIPHMQALFKRLCKQGFEHHVAMVRSHCAGMVSEAVTTYLGWDLYVHES
jgi:L-fucose isomerase-like protein